MAGRIRAILARFTDCYTITRSVQQSFRFAFAGTSGGKYAISVSGRKIWLRKNKADREVFVATFLYQFHRSPIDLGSAPTIVDLGSNTGLTIIDFKDQYPQARIIGAEPDANNYELCVSNIKGLVDCSVVQTAIWKSGGTITYAGNDEQSYSINNETTAPKGSAKAKTLDSFMQENKIERIDYLKMDIEGAEYAVLLDSPATSWLEKVRYLSIEVHNTPLLSNEEGMKQLRSVLEKNNFIVLRSSKHWSSLFAINKSFLPS